MIIWWSYNDEDEEGSWEAKITSFVRREDKIVIEFEGHQENGKYTGILLLNKKDKNIYFGTGKVEYPKKELEAKAVNVQEVDENCFEGKWNEDNSVYEFGIE